jgi:glycosyltransferase involved in cell wall biosynthesis
VKIVLCNFNNGIYAYASGDPSAVGGAERQQWLLARALTAAGWSVTVGLQGLPELEDGATIEDVHFVSLPGTKSVSTPYRRLLCLYRFLRSELPDWWYWRCASHLWGPAVSIAKLLGVRTIFAAGFDADVLPRRALAGRPKWWPLYSWGLANTDRIFVQHSGQFSELSEKLRSKAAIVSNIVHMPATIKRHDERERYIAWVGMLRQPKRPDLLVEIARKAQNLHFVVCGGPSDHRSPNGYGSRIVAELKSLSNVDYRGQIASHEARKIIANSSILLCTSEREGFPNTFLEAWASGTAVVSMTVDPDFLIQQRRLGIVSGSVAQAISDLNYLLQAEQEREAISHRARRYVCETHDESVVVDVVQRVLQTNDSQLILQSQSIGMQ